MFRIFPPPEEIPAAVAAGGLMCLRDSSWWAPVGADPAAFARWLVPRDRRTARIPMAVDRARRNEGRTLVRLLLFSSADLQALEKSGANRLTVVRTRLRPPDDLVLPHGAPFRFDRELGALVYRPTAMSVAMGGLGRYRRFFTATAHARFREWELRCRSVALLAQGVARINAVKMRLGRDVEDVRAAAPVIAYASNAGVGGADGTDAVAAAGEAWQEIWLSVGALEGDLMSAWEACNVTAMAGAVQRLEGLVARIGGIDQPRGRQARGRLQAARLAAETGVGQGGMG